MTDNDLDKFLEGLTNTLDALNQGLRHPNATDAKAYLERIIREAQGALKLLEEVYG